MVSSWNKSLCPLFNINIMKGLIIILLFLPFISIGQNQIKYDTIYAVHKSIICKIKELDRKNVKFSYPNEDLVVTMSIKSIVRIKFSSGREQIFKDIKDVYIRDVDVADLSTGTILKEVPWDKVSITHFLEDTSYLYKLDSIVSFFALSGNLEAQMLKKDIYNKLKNQAYMLGGNLIFISNSKSYLSGEGKLKIGGVVYTNQLPNIEDFKVIVETQPNQKISEVITYLPKYKEARVKYSEKNIDLEGYKIKGDFVYVPYGEKSNSPYLKLIYLEKDKIVLMGKKGERIVNYIVLL